MATGYVEGDTNLQFGGAEASITITLAAGNRVYAAFAWSSTTETLTSIQSDLDGAFTLANNPTGIAAGRSAHGYLTVATAGSHTITTTRSANTSSCELQVFELSDAGTVVANTINAQTAPGTGTDAVTSTAITTAANGILIGVSFDIGNASAPNLGTGMTACTVTNAGTLGRPGRKATAGAGPTALTWTETDAAVDMLSTAMAFAPAGSSAVAPSVNDAVTVAETVGMKMHLHNTAANDSVTATEAITMHMPIGIRMEKLA